jgi:tetratricopeptide (TPR) repeat protein
MVRSRSRGFGAWVAPLAVAVVALAACTTAGKSATSGSGACRASAKPRDEFSCVVKNDPNDQYGWYNLGVVEQRDGNTGKAASDYLKAIAIQPDFEAALYKLGVIRLQSGQYTAAVTLLDRAVAAGPKDANALFKLASALGHLHTASANERAKAVLNRALALNPPSPGFPPTSTSK